MEAETNNKSVMDGVELVETILRLCGPVSQKKLQKLAYLLEIEYIKRHGKRLSDLSFIRYYYGPFSNDIVSLEEEDENIERIRSEDPHYTFTYAKLIAQPKIKSVDKDLEQEIREILEPFKDKTGKELEEIADKTEPYLETENKGDLIDLYGYAWYINKISSDEFWDNVEKKDKDNEKRGIYGRRIVKKDKEFEPLLY